MCANGDFVGLLVVSVGALVFFVGAAVITGASDRLLFSNGDFDG